MSMLDEHRIDQMRDTVMAGVDDDVRRRRGRVRRTIGVTSAAAFVVVTGGLGLQLVGQSDGPSGFGGTSSDSAAAPPAGSRAPEISGPADADRSGGAQTTPVEPSTGTGQRQEIVTGSASVVTDDPADAVDQIAAWVEDHDGRIDSRSIDGEGEDATADLTIRVPSDQVSALIKELGRHGEVTSQDIAKADVTASVRDLDGRIDALKASIDRLEALIADASSTRELLDAEQALTDRQAQYEQLLGQRRALGDQVELASIDVSLRADDRAEQVDPGGFTGGLQDGWNALVGVVNDVVEGVGVALPFAAVLLVVAGAWLLVRRLRR